MPLLLYSSKYSFDEYKNEYSARTYFLWCHELFYMTWGKVVGGGSIGIVVLWNYNRKVVSVPVDATKAYKRIGGVAPLILNLRTRWRRKVSFNYWPFNPPTPTHPRKRPSLHIEGWLDPKTGWTCCIPHTFLASTRSRAPDQPVRIPSTLSQIRPTPMQNSFFIFLENQLVVNTYFY